MASSSRRSFRIVSPTTTAFPLPYFSTRLLRGCPWKWFDSWGFRKSHTTTPIQRLLLGAERPLKWIASQLANWNIDLFPQYTLNKYVKGLTGLNAIDLAGGLVLMFVASIITVSVVLPNIYFRYFKGTYLSHWVLKLFLFAFHINCFGLRHLVYE